MPRYTYCENALGKRRQEGSRDRGGIGCIGILRCAQDDNKDRQQQTLTTKYQGAVVAGIGAGGEADFSAAAANAPPSVEMTGVRLGRGFGWDGLSLGWALVGGRRATTEVCQ